MEIELERSGGLTGIRRSTGITTGELPPSEETELRKLVQAANFFSLPERLQGPGADRFQYRVTIKDGSQVHQVIMDDAAIPEAMRAVINWIVTRKSWSTV